MEGIVAKAADTYPRFWKFAAALTAGYAAKTLPVSRLVAFHKNIDLLSFYCATQLHYLLLKHHIRWHQRSRA